MRSPLGARSMTGMGHEERFPPPRLSAGYGFRKETIAGTRRNGRDAPIRVIRLSCSERVKPDPDRSFIPRENLVSRNALATAVAPLYPDDPRIFADAAGTDRAAFRRISQINRTALPAILPVWRSTGLAVRISKHVARSPSH